MRSTLPSSPRQRFARRAAAAFCAVFAAGTALAAAPSIEVAITYAPDPAFTAADLAATATLVKVEFRASGDPLYVPIGSLPFALTPGAASSATFIPTDPCVGDGTCPVGFLLTGFSGAFETFAFADAGAAPATRPELPPIVPVGTFMPGDPCIGGNAVCSAGGALVAYGAAPVPVGTWNVAIQAAAVPEPASALLGLLGLGALAFARRRAAQHR